MTKVDSLKKLAVLCTDAETEDDVTGNTIAEVLDFIANNFVLEKPESQ